MPFYQYCVDTKSQAENFTTSGTGNTEIDFLFVKPGASRRVFMYAVRGQGKVNAGSTLTGIVLRVKAWTTTASSGGTAATPAPKDKIAPACVATAGMGTSGGTAAVISGTGGPNIVGRIGFGSSGPGGWVAANIDDMISLDGNANMSIDLFSSSPTASMNFEAAVDIQE